MTFNLDLLDSEAIMELHRKYTAQRLNSIQSGESRLFSMMFLHGRQYKIRFDDWHIRDGF